MGTENENKKIEPARQSPAKILSVLLTVLVAGYLVMSLEILGFRIVQVHFGSSIFSTGALLGVVLTALSLGYWLGGTFSSKISPSFLLFPALFIAGIWIFLLAGLPSGFGNLIAPRDDPTVQIQYLIQPLWKSIPAYVLEHPMSESLEIRLRTDPLLGSLILFFLPSMLLAMVSPCMIHTLTRRTEEAGKISGWVFALGSIGSIAGVVVTSFWLISLFGMGANLRIIGVVTIILSLIALTFGHMQPHTPK